MPYMKYDLVPPGGHLAVSLTGQFQPTVDLASAFAHARWSFLERPVTGDVARLVRELGPEMVILCCDAQRREDLLLIREIAQGHRGELIAYSRSSTAETDALFLDWGADDCLHAHDPDDLVRAVIRAAVRRFEARGTDQSRIPETPSSTLGDIHINTNRYEVRVGSQPVHFPAAEYRILVALAGSAGAVLSPRELMEAASHTFYSDIEARDSAKVYIGRIRTRLADHGIPRTAVRNVRGFGYVLEPRDCSIDYAGLLHA